MKLIICVKSCLEHMNLGFHEVIRQTWGRDAKAIGIETKFFYGGGSLGKHQSDEIQIDCPDDYNNLPLKTRRICDWATGKLIDKIFLCDTDTFLVPSLMLEPDFMTADYAGRFNGNSTRKIRSYIAVDRAGTPEIHQDIYPWASGGYGYFLSRPAWMRISERAPHGWAEDMYVGQVLGPAIESGEMTVLDTTDREYSRHFPSHEYKAGYSLEFGWMEQQYLQQYPETK